MYLGTTLDNKVVTFFFKDSKSVVTGKISFTFTVSIPENFDTSLNC